MFRQPMMNLRIYINNININNQLELIQNILTKFIHSLHYYYYYYNYYISFIASIHKLLHQIANIYIIFDVWLIIIIIIIINATLSLYFFKTDGDFII